MPLRGRDPVDAERGGDRDRRRARPPPVEPPLAAEEVVRVEVAEHEVGVGDRRLVAAVAVAGRARHRAGAFRPDMQHAAGVDPRDRAAAGADAGDVEALQRDAVAADSPV